MIKMSFKRLSRKLPRVALCCSWCFKDLNLKPPPPPPTPTPHPLNLSWLFGYNKFTVPFASVLFHSIVFALQLVEWVIVWTVFFCISLLTPAFGPATYYVEKCSPDTIFSSLECFECHEHLKAENLRYISSTSESST